MTYEEYESFDFKEGQNLTTDRGSCVFVEHDECYGAVWVRFSSKDKDETISIECINILEGE